ncbi:MAG: hypothetical protein M0R02_09380 [Bacteroidales bacterium]|nr:hypothetical protein [Bacteroidales bacterium]
MKKNVIIAFVIIAIVAVVLYFTSGSKNTDEPEFPAAGSSLKVSAWYQKYSQAMINSLNQWIRDYTQKWHPGDSEKQKEAAVWQMWEAYKKTGKTEFPTTGINLKDFPGGYNQFLNFLISEGIVAQLKTY